MVSLVLRARSDPEPSVEAPRRTQDPSAEGPLRESVPARGTRGDSPEALPRFLRLGVPEVEEGAREAEATEPEEGIGAEIAEGIGPGITEEITQEPPESTPEGTQEPLGPGAEVAELSTETRAAPSSIGTEAPDLSTETRAPDLTPDTQAPDLVPETRGDADEIRVASPPVPPRPGAPPSPRTPVPPTVEAAGAAREERSGGEGAETREAREPGPPEAGGGAAPRSAEGASEAPPAGGVGRGPEPLMPPPPAGLSGEERERLQAVDRRAGAAVGAATDLPSAGQQVGEAREAVEEPAPETQARAQDRLVEVLGERPAPSPEIDELCDRIRQAIRAKRPPDEESLVDARPQEMAQEAGRDLDESVRGDAERVQGEYGALEEEPVGTPTREASPLAAPPGPAEMPEVDGAHAVPEGVSPESVSLDADVEASRQQLDDAGMNTAPAELVQSGPIAEAREAQGALTETAAQDPQAVLAEQQTVLATASADMAGLTSAALAALQGGRAEATRADRGQQVGMVGSEEAMRVEAAARAEGIFSDAQTRVSDLLEPLPRTAMARWEAGVAVLSTRFEQHLARVQRWIDERHESTVLAVVDYLTGLPDWVTEEYDQAEEAFGDGVCELIREISTEVNGVILACEAIIDDARTRIDEVFDSLPASLQEWAGEQQAAFGERLDGLQQQAEQTRSDFTRDLTERAAEAVQSVREQVHELREAARGLLGRIADAVNAFLEDPARFILEGLLELVGIAPRAFWALVDRIGQAIEDIADDPLGFADNLMSALGQGFQQFFDNIADHLLQGLLDWLFSGLGAVGVQIPSDTSLGSIVTFFLQLMGVTWENVREILVRHVGEENVALVERAWELVSTLIEMGPEGLFELVKEQLDPANLLNLVLESAVEFLIEALISAVTPRIIALFNPVGAILQAIEAIYRVLRWIFENAARIFSLVETVVNGVADLIAGNIGGMAAAVEGALAGLITPVIDFLAGYLGLGNLPDRIADLIGGMQQRVLAVVERVIGFLADRARALLRAMGVGEADEEGVEGEEDPEKAERVRAGLAAIEVQEARRTEAGRISREEAEEVAAAVRREHTVFTVLEVIDGGDSWDYRWAASPGDVEETGATKEEAASTSGFVGRRIDEPSIPDELAQAGYRRPYQRQGRWIIARRDASSGLPALSVRDGVISQESTPPEEDRGEVVVDLQAILSALPPHPHRHLFSIDPTAGQLRLGSSLRKEALSAYRPRTTAQMRRAIDHLTVMEDETEGLVEVPVGGPTELAEVESTGQLPPAITGSGLRASAMSEELIDWFVDLRRSGWPVGWEVHHVVPTDWGGGDGVSNYAAIPGALHGDITSWWNRLRGLILRTADAAAAREDGTTSEYRSITFE